MWKVKCAGCFVSPVEWRSADLARIITFELNGRGVRCWVEWRGDKPPSRMPERRRELFLLDPSEGKSFRLLVDHAVL